MPRLGRRRHVFSHALKRYVVVPGAVVVVVVPISPDSKRQQWHYQSCTGVGLSQCQPARHGELEDDEPKNNTVYNHWPCLSCGMAGVIHGVEELILVRKVSQEEVDQAKRKDEYPTLEDAIDDADDKDKDRLWEEEAVLKHGRLHELGEV